MTHVFYYNPSIVLMFERKEIINHDMSAYNHSMFYLHSVKSTSVFTFVLSLILINFKPTRFIFQRTKHAFFKKDERSNEVAFNSTSNQMQSIQKLRDFLKHSVAKSKIACFYITIHVDY